MDFAKTMSDEIKKQTTDALNAITQDLYDLDFAFVLNHLVEENSKLKKRLQNVEEKLRLAPPSKIKAPKLVDRQQLAEITGFSRDTITNHDVRKIIKRVPMEYQKASVYYDLKKTLEDYLRFKGLRGNFRHNIVEYMETHDFDY